MYSDGEINLSRYKILSKKESSIIYDIKQRQYNLLNSKKYYPDHPLYVSSKSQMSSTLDSYELILDNYITEGVHNADVELKNFSSDIIKMVAKLINVKSLDEVNIEFYEENCLVPGYLISKK